MANVEDQRYARTEAAIRSSYLELVSAGPKKPIAVSELCRHAGISRNAFYSHYESISALFTALTDEFIDGIRAESLASAARILESGVDDSFETTVMRVLAQHEELIRALCPSDNGQIAQYFADSLERAFMEAAKEVGARYGDLEHRLYYAYMAWALVGYVRQWVLQTNRPLKEGLTYYRTVQSGVTRATTEALLETRGLPQGAQTSWVDSLE